MGRGMDINFELIAWQPQINSPLNGDRKTQATPKEVYLSIVKSMKVIFDIIA